MSDRDVPRPLIALAGATETARWGSWERPADLLARGYSEAVRGAGGAALIAPPDPVWADDPASLCDRVDGMLLAGGGDIDPALFGQPRHPATVRIDPLRDRFEIALVREALARGLPVLGICRGMQVLAVADGAPLDQDLDAELLAAHRSATVDFIRHDVVLEPGSLAARAAGAERVRVFSHHHQAPTGPGERLVVSGRAPDGVIEALELPGAPFALGVLWHPEEDAADRVVAALVGAAAQWSAARQPPTGSRGWASASAPARLTARGPALEFSS